MHDEFELFKGTTFSDLMKDIYHNSKKKDRQINTLIQELQPLIKNIGDATVIVPLIKEYLDASNFFLDTSQTKYLNALLDNIAKKLRSSNARISAD